MGYTLWPSYSLRAKYLLDEFHHLVARYAAFVGFTPTFREYVSIISPRVKMVLKKGQIRSRETSVRNIPHDDRIQVNCSGSLRSRLLDG